ncbi:MAG: multidrug effflux MFS transporter [Williamsia sp.]|nr:multidrug effflux MFS transporter [Williamsia sp.]
MQITKRRYFFLVLILGTLSAIGPFSIDMYLPGFPSIAAHLHTTVSQVALSLSSFFIGISAGQLLYGPLLDRFGRKKPLYFGISLYILASLGCAAAGSVDALIALRFLQALGGCAGMVAARAMVRDIFPVSENAKVFSLLMLVIAVSPLIAPTLGGYIAANLDWHYIFFVLTGIGVFILAGVHFVLPESRKPDQSVSLKPRSIVQSFYSVFTEPQFYTYVFTSSIASAGLYAYIAGSPAVFIQIYKATAEQYGWIFAFAAMGLIGSSQLNSVLLKKYRSEQIVVGALLCQSLIGLVYFLGMMQGWWNLYAAVGGVFLFLCCQGFQFPNASALALAPFEKKAGSASALMGSIQMSLGALASAIVSFLSDSSHTALPMSGVMAACACGGFCMLMIGTKFIRYNASKQKVEEEAAEMMETV